MACFSAVLGGVVGIVVAAALCAAGYSKLPSVLFGWAAGVITMVLPLVRFATLARYRSFNL